MVRNLGKWLGTLSVATATAMLQGGVSLAQSCTEYRKPETITLAQLYDMPFGTLALRYTSDRFALLDVAGCYSVATYVKGGELHLVVNNKADASATHYLAATVLRTFRHQIADVKDLYSVQFWRNGNKPDVPGKWASIDTSRARGSTAGALEAATIINEYSSQEGVDTGAAGDLRKLVEFDPARPEHAKWHAWIVEEQDGKYNVVRDTRVRAGAIAIDSLPIALEGIETILARLYMVKFAGSPDPSPPEDMIKIGIQGPPRCIYMRHNFDGEAEPVLKEGALDNYMVLRIDPAAVC